MLLPFSTKRVLLDCCYRVRAVPVGVAVSIFQPANCRAPSAFRSVPLCHPLSLPLCDVVGELENLELLTSSNSQSLFAHLLRVYGVTNVEVIT
ncbi:uncharacterized protein KRP23_1782 [Phytophthora ramorum]|uniref:uncharacterized protein n=1 Tax=Phytophthora ramorum TaxID=164328 RepID=UPI00309FD8B8|nr:hypothetical protein KRP23_1782 [Phytophthora ramorum]